MKSGVKAVAVAIFALGMCAHAFALPAYIDVQSGIIVGRGEAAMDRGGSYSAAREQAIRDARQNLYSVLERQPVDVNSMEPRTIGEFLKMNPSKKRILDDFIGSGTIIKELKDEDGKVEVTIVLPVEGDSGYKAMLLKLAGKESEISDDSRSDSEIDAEISSELKKHLAGRSPDELGQPYRIAMPDFYNDTDFKGAPLGIAFAEKLKKIFSRDRRFAFLSDSESGKVLDASGWDADSLWSVDIKKIIKLKNIDGVVIGAVTKFEPDVKKHGLGGTGYLETTFNMEIDLRILNASTGRWSVNKKIPLTVTDRTFTLNELDDADSVIKMNDLDDEKGLASKVAGQMAALAATEIRNVFPVEGYVLKVIGGRVYVNLANGDGIAAGDMLTVYRLGDMLKDPLTGKDVDRILDRIATVKVTDVNDTYSQTETTETPLEPVNPGDIVRVQ